MKSQKEYAKITAKIWSDPKFKERFLKNPEAVLREEGIELPKGEKVEIHENTGKIFHFVLPRKPSGELSVTELEVTAGGTKEHAKVIAKAWSDPKFRERLLKNPEAVLREQGIELPKGGRIEVCENTSKIHHFVLSKKPSGMSVTELEAVAAAGMCQMCCGYVDR